MYDENSFLQGIAVGRAMKGVEVITGGGNGGVVKAAAQAVTVGIVSVGMTVPNLMGMESIAATGMLIIDTQHKRTSHPTVPSAIAVSGIAITGSTARIAAYSEGPDSSVPNGMGHSFSVGATMALDEEE